MLIDVVGTASYFGTCSELVDILDFSSLKLLPLNRWILLLITLTSLEILSNYRETYGWDIGIFMIAG